MRYLSVQSSLALACGGAIVLLAGCCCCDTEAWQTGHRDIVGGTPVVVPSPAWGEMPAAEGRPTVRAAMQARRAVAMISPTEGNNATGTVRFADTPQGLHITGDLQKLPPSSMLGFHIHEFGDLSAPDAMSAGGHYNPEGRPHGGPADAMHHAGDLGNIQSDAGGNARIDLTMKDLSLTGENPVLGRSIVVHAKADDLKSQPAGNSGARIGAGVIGLVK